MSEDRSASVLLSFLLGSITGAALAVLFAPRAGQETRDLLQERFREGAEGARDLRDRANERGRELRDKAVERGRELASEAERYVERKRETVASRKERLAAAVDAGRQAYQEEKQKS